MTPPLTLQTADVASALSNPSWWELPTLRRLLPDRSATTLGYSIGPDPASPAYAFLAVDVTPAYAPSLTTVHRFFVQLRGDALLALDLAVGKGDISWRLEGKIGPTLSHRSLLPKPGSPAGNDHIFLNVLHSPALDVELIRSLGLAGARVGQTVVLFHTEVGMASSSLFFDLHASGKLRFLIAGLSPGVWEVWRDGFLEENTHKALPGSGVVVFEAEAGDFFLRQR